MSDTEDDENLDVGSPEQSQSRSSQQMSQNLSQRRSSQLFSENLSQTRNSPHPSQDRALLRFTQQMPPPNTEQSYKPGSIKSINLINFMCHKSFHIDLGPSVNFIIGPNGSGKSALLTALVVALGGRASITSRAKKACEFVKLGCNYARVTVVLHNYSKIMEKERAFKPDEYGKSVTIEKTIYTEQPAKLVLKSDKGKKVSERSQELSDMLEHFDVLINNPICILNQEISKTFLHSKKPEDKFDLFMKATNLEQIREDYDEAQKRHVEWKDCIDSKTPAFKLLDAEYASCVEKLKFLENRNKLTDTYRKLNTELAWAVARDSEQLSESVSAKIQKVGEQIIISQDLIEKYRNKVKKHREELDLMKSNIQSLYKEQEVTQKKLQDIKEREFGSRTSKAHAISKLDQNKRTLIRLQDDKSSLESTINDLRKQYRAQNSLDQDSEYRKLEIERLDSELQSDRAREKSLRAHTDQLSSSMTNTRAELNSANSRVNSIKGQLSASNAHLRRLKNGQVSAIRKYGDFVIKIREEVDIAFEQKRFITKPIGPLGYYVKLESPDVAPAIEIHLGKNANAFVCDNQKDMTTLQSIIRRLSTSRPDFRSPTIIIRPFGRKHDTRRFRASHDSYKTLLDYMNIEEDAVYNVLVDRLHLESVLFIPEHSDAESLMLDQNQIPRNTRCAYTKDGYVMHPKTASGGYKSFAPNMPISKCVLFTEDSAAQVRETEREISLCEEELRDAEHIVRGFQETLAAHRLEYDGNIAETKKLMVDIRAKEEKLLDLKTVVSRVPEELTDLEADLENSERKIVECKLTIENLKEQLSTIENDLKDIAKEKESCQAIIDKRDEQRQAHHTMMEGTKKSIHDSETMIKNEEKNIDHRNKEKVELQKEMDDVLDKLSRVKRALPDGDKPEPIRKTDHLREEIRKIETLLRIEEEEQRDPEELKEWCMKRMEECKALGGLKDSNINNCKLAGKSIKMRHEGLTILETVTVASVGSTFSAIMRTLNMKGDLFIHLSDVVHEGEVVKKAGTLDMRIDTNYSQSSQQVSVMNDANNNSDEQNRRTSRSQPVGRPPRAKRPRRDAGDLGSSPSEKENGGKNMTDARSLSGGERSFSTVAFVLALWHHCHSPFKLMDEIDVFMDMVTRRVSYNALIRFAQCSDEPGQFVFFSPLELPKFENDCSSNVKVFEMPEIIRGSQKG